MPMPPSSAAGATFSAVFHPGWPLNDTMPVSASMIGCPFGPASEFSVISLPFTLLIWFFRMTLSLLSWFGFAVALM